MFLSAAVSLEREKERGRGGKVERQTQPLNEISDNTIHTIRRRRGKSQAVWGGDIGHEGGRKKDEKMDRRAHTHTHIHMRERAPLLPAPGKGHLQSCQASRAGQRSGFDNWREFREQASDKHDKALTALIGP